MYSPKSSGLLKGGGRRKGKRRRNVMRQGLLAHMPDVHISDVHAIKTQVWDFDPEWEFEYSNRELLLMAEKILLLDPKPMNEYPAWISADKYVRRIRPREIFTSSGIPDPAIASGLYWRTHPEGRKVSSDQQRRDNGASYYR